MQSNKKEITLPILIGVIGLGLLIAIVAIELLFRGVGYLSKPSRWSDRPIGYFMPDTARSLQDGGLAPKAPGVFRVSVVGDSFTFGPHLHLMDTFPKKLENLLNLNKQVPPVEVLNRGYSGYSTVNEVEMVKRTLEESPDLILLQVTLNDAEPHILSANERRELFEAPYLTSPYFRIWSSLGFLLGRIHNNKSRNAYIDYHSKYFFQEDTYSAFSLAIKSMHEMCKQKKVPMVVSLFPLFDFPVNDKYPFLKVHSQIAAAVKSERLLFLDLRAAYINIPPDRLQVIPGKDSHPNEIANRIAAERLLAFLAQSRLLPAASIPRRVYPQRRGHMGKQTSFSKVVNRSMRPLQEPDLQLKKKSKKAAKQRKRRLRETLVQNVR